jgi:nucleotide-binding universal stress UspA family protein
MYKKLLVPLDGSKLAEVALPYAEELAGRLGSRVDLFYVSESTNIVDQHNSQFYLKNKADAIKDIIKLYSKEFDRNQETRVASVLETGHPAEKIIEYAEKEDIGMTIMSTHGRSGVLRWTLGSVADKVVRGTRKPVMLIRAKNARSDIHDKKLLSKMLVPLDGSREGETVIPHVAELANRLKAEVNLIQVLPVGYQLVATGDYIAYTDKQMESDKASAKKYLGNLETQLKKNDVNVKTIIKLKNVNAAEEIIAFADEIKADVVVMATHGRSGIGRWVLGSTAERVLHDGNTPIMLVRAQRL